MEKKYVKTVTALKKDPGFKPFRGGVAQYSVAFDDGEKIVNVVNTNVYCHAGLNNPGGGKYGYEGGEYKYVGGQKGVPVAVFNSICNIVVDDKIALRYLEWLQNFSPWAEIWMTKSARVTLKQGVMVANTDVPSNLLAGGMFASRSIWEYPNIALVWNAFVERGLHPQIAYYLAHIFDTSWGNISWHPKSGHVALDGNNCIPTHIVNFLTNNRDDQPSYRETKNYTNVHATWKKPNEDVKIVVDHSKLLTEVRNEDGKGKVNPFNKNIAKVVKLEAATEYLTPIYRELFKKWI